MPIPSLPHWQDCHELWSKRRRRQLRDHPPVPEGGNHPNTGSSSASAATVPVQSNQSQPASNTGGFKFS